MQSECASRIGLARALDSPTPCCFLFYFSRYALHAVLKYNQTTRGAEGLQSRMAERAATHTSWRQMKGMERVMFEVRTQHNAGGRREETLPLVVRLWHSPLTYFCLLRFPTGQPPG
jgi:hypothetical protein